MTQAGHIRVVYGSTTVDVPRRLFKGRGCEIDEEEAGRFRETTMARCPWISERSMDVLMKKARMEMLRVMDEETGGRNHSRMLAEEGRVDDAVAHLRLRLEEDPGDADSWYALGELLCRRGDAEEGYAAINRGSELAQARRSRKGR